jgi:hypothetical protein
LAQEILREFSLCQVVPNQGDMVFLEHLQRNMDAQTTNLLHSACDFAAEISNTVRVHTDAIHELSEELEHMMAEELSCSHDMSPFCEYLQHTHNVQIHVAQDLATVPPAFVRLVQLYERNKRDMSAYISEADSASQHGTGSHEGMLVHPGPAWMNDIREIHCGNSILSEIQKLCAHLVRSRMEVQQMLQTDAQFSEFCTDAQNTYSAAMLHLQSRTKAYEMEIVSTLHLKIRFVVVCIFIECAVNANNNTEMSQCDRQSLEATFRVRVRAVCDSIAQDILQQQNMCTLPESCPQSADLHATVDRIHESELEISELCTRACMDTNNHTWGSMLQSIVNLLLPTMFQAQSPAPLMPARDSGIHAGGGGGFGAGGDDHDSQRGHGGDGGGGGGGGDGGSGGSGGNGGSGGRGGSGGNGGPFSPANEYISFTSQMVRCMHRNLVLTNIRQRHWLAIDVNL